MSDSRPPIIPKRTFLFGSTSYAFHAQHHLQRHCDINRLAAGRPRLQFRRHVLPCGLGARLFRQMTEQRSHIGERLERHHAGDDERPGYAAPQVGGIGTGRSLVEHRRNNAPIQIVPPNLRYAAFAKRTKVESATSSSMTFAACDRT